MRQPTIRVVFADDSLIVRQGVRALIELAPDLEVIGEASDYDSLIEAVERTEPDVIVTDIRMPPTFQMEGIRAALELRKRRPGLAAAVLSQYVDPEYALALLRDGAAGLAYLLKDRVADRDQLIRAIRMTSTGGSLLDPKVMEGVLEPATSSRLLKPGGVPPPTAATACGPGDSLRSHTRKGHCQCREKEPNPHPFAENGF